MAFNQQDLILNFDRIRTDVTNFIRGNPLVSAGVGIGTPLAVVGIGSGISRFRSRATKKRKAKTPKRKAKTKRRTTRTKKKRKYGLRKAVRSKKIRTTKNGQPYIILADGRARFIKKSSSRSAKKRKGGFS